MKLHLREKNGDMNSPEGNKLRKGVQSRSYTSLTLAFTVAGRHQSHWRGWRQRRSVRKSR
jgi:hypothetical protein